MTRQTSALEFNTFVKGLITEAGPLTFPENASVDEANWVLLKNGSRRRRLGMNFETNYQNIITNQYLPSTGNMEYNTFLWENAGGNPDLQILVIQIGAQISFIDRNDVPISDGLIHQHTVEGLGVDVRFSFSSVGGKLIVATGQKELLLFDIDSSLVVSQTSYRLKIRDLFGVQANHPDGRDLLDGPNITLRPTLYIKEHVYNLRNQTWGPARLLSSDTADFFVDTMAEFIVNRSPNADGAPADGILKLVGSEWRVYNLEETDYVIFNKAAAAVVNGETLSTLAIHSAGQLDYRGDAALEPAFEFNFLIGYGYLIFQFGAWDFYSVNPSVIAGFPSNADSIIPFMFADAWVSHAFADPYADRFHDTTAARTVPGTSRAPMGYFIIDALDRGESRIQELQRLHARYPQLQIFVDSLPADYTNSGATAIESYAGRIFYAGFSGEVIDGDAQSPDYSSYIFFSQLVKGTSTLGSCYQQGDPTSKEEPDIIDTDGGFIRIDGAYGIKKLVAAGSALIVLASNGVWSIQGGSDYGFTATNYLVTKISDHSIVGRESVVVIDNTIMFWGLDGIYSVGPTETGAYGSQNLTKNTIQTFYSQISDEDKISCKGFYDSYDNKVLWIYGSTVEVGGVARELVFDTTFGSFYPSTINTVAGGYPFPVGIVGVKPYRLDLVTENVTHLGENVTYLGEQVTYTFSRRQNAIREAMYVTITGSNPVQFTLSTYNDSGFMDWRSYNGTGVDSPAHLVTGYISVGDFQRKKQAPYITFHFFRTEDGFTDVSGDLVPNNQSSCLVRAAWEWSNSANSNKWGSEFQAYRYKRFYLPASVSDPYDTGHETIVTKNKIRGSGRVLSLRIRTEPGKDCYLHGWSMLMGVAGNV